MSLFPFINQQEPQEAILDEKRIPIEYGIDFETGKLTGRTVKGKEAIKVWIYKALMTERYKYLIYTWDHGVELEELISKNFDREFIESEVERYIKEALLVNEYIKEINNFHVTFEKTLLTCDFTVVTEFGEVHIHDKRTNV
ncbi:DUF2634 domain-containing protein [Niameybacter massiliensis]|uniref:DUF2634 domain-containing protein n=1 Tax=Niameybacter massiliensis TaxID=1658108 RepID=UPI0006B4877D|nr:DUF2634 domain-containing protein [Niameybacter massiliensis]